MNKISKKIVALATMAAFVLTLVPAAAFAATTPSYVEIDQKTQEITLDAGQATASVDVTVDTKDAGNNVVVWLTTGEGENEEIYHYATVGGTDATDIGGNFKGAAVLSNPAAGNYNVTFTFTEAGVYTVHAGVDYGNNAPTIADLDQIFDVDGVNTITVDSPAVDELRVYPMGETTNYIVWDDNDSYELNLVGNPNFDADGIGTYSMDTYTLIDGQLAPNETITVESGNDLVLQIRNADEDPDTDGVQITTDRNGKATISFRMDDNRNVPIYLSAGKVEYTLKIVKEETTPYDIDTTLDDGYVLAGDDDRWDDSARLFTDAVQFSVKDITGDAITGDLATVTDESDGHGGKMYTGEPAASNGYTDGRAHAEKFSIESQPIKSDLEETDLVLAYDENANVYTLEYVGSEDTVDTKLVPGEYKVRVGLKSGDWTEATFNVAYFGDVEDIEVSMSARDRSTYDDGNTADRVRNVSISDEVTLGQNVYATAKLVDKNGMKVTAQASDNVVIGAYGRALIDGRVASGNLEFQTVDDITANQSLIGTEVTVTVTSNKYGITYDIPLQVVDSYNTFSLEFDPAEGPINEDTDVTVKVVKEDGSIAQVRGEIVSAYVADQSNADAKVLVEGVGNPVTKGKGKISVYASEPTTVDIVVAVQDATNQGLYAATLEYNAGNADITAHHEVTMTIGSSQYVVDKQLFEMDAAPYVDSNWRTMVPIRALAEAFDAEVVYDNDARTVTINYNNETIVMTIGDATYTVNGEEAEMDTEAVINSADDRTYVPVRFAAEAMGFTVTALYDENDSTASVVFQS